MEAIALSNSEFDTKSQTTNPQEVQLSAYQTLRLVPTQIGDHWGLIRKGIFLTELQPPGELFLADVLQQLLDERLVCWLVIDPEDADELNRIKAMAITGISPGIGGVTNTLTIQAVASFGFLTAKTWMEAFGVLEDWARMCNCSKIRNFVTQERMLKVQQRLGFMATGIVVEKEVSR